VEAAYVAPSTAGRQRRSLVQGPPRRGVEGTACRTLTTAANGLHLRNKRLRSFPVSAYNARHLTCLVSSPDMYAIRARDEFSTSPPFC